MTDPLEGRLRRALDELAMSTPLTNSERPRKAEHPSSAPSTEAWPSQPQPSANDEGGPPQRPPWMDVKILALATCVVLLVVAVVTVGLHHQGTKPHKRITTSTSTTTPPTTTVPEPVPTTTIPPTSTTAPVRPAGYTAALASWEAGTHVPTFQGSTYLLQAASDLANAVNSGSGDTSGYTTAVTELRQMATVYGGAGLDATQAAELTTDATALNKFFGTSGAYGSAY